MGGETSRAFDQFVALGERHRAVASVVAAAAAWASAAAASTQNLAEEVAWARAVADGTGDKAGLGWWWSVDERPTPVVPMEYAQRLDGLHADMGTALVIPAAVMEHAGLGARTVKEYKEAIDRSWAEDRFARTYYGEFDEAKGLLSELVARRDEWVAEVVDAPHFLAEAGVFTTWLPRYFAATDDLVYQAAYAMGAAYGAAVRAKYEPMLVMERPDEATARRHGLPMDEHSLRFKAQCHAASYITAWMRALAAGGVDDEGRQATLRTLEPKYGAAVARYRRLQAQLGGHD